MNRTMITLAAAMSFAACAMAQTYDISFKGGTAKEYYNELREAIPGLNLVVDPDVDYFMVPEVNLYDVSTLAAVSAPAMLVEGIETDLIEADGMYVMRVDPDAMRAMLASPRTFDLEFEGGSLGSLVEELREVADANIMISPGAAGIPVPPMRFRRTTVWDTLGTIEREPLDPEHRLELSSFMGPGEGSIYVLKHKGAESGRDLTQALRIETWSLGAMIAGGGIGADDVISAIDAAEEFFVEEVSVRYHEGTRVLIARGVAEDLRVIDRLIDRIAESSHFMGEQR